MRYIMKNQKGSAKLVLGVIAFFFSAFLLMGGALVMMYIDAANYGNATEVTLEQSWSDLQNVHGQYTLKVQEVAAVPETYKNDLKEVMVGVMQSRMGQDGSKALFQFFKEHNINIDSAMYIKIQQIIEAGRNQIEVHTRRVLDVKGTYQERLGRIPDKFFLAFAGYPKVDLAKYKPIVSNHTKETFETGVDKAVKLR